MLEKPKSVFELAEEKNRSKNPRDTYDYFYGVLDAYLRGEPITNEFNHWSDAGKRDDHPTYSNESWFSKYGNRKGGQWIRGQDGKWTFAPREWQVVTPEQERRLYEYLYREQGKGIDSVQLPDGRIIEPATEMIF